MLQSVVEHYLISTVFVTFVLFYKEGMCMRILVLSNLCKIQLRTLEGPMYFGAFTLNSAHLEFLGLMVMTWKTLK